MLIGIGSVQISAAPLVADYIKQPSRGVATSIGNMGTLIGEAAQSGLLVSIGQLQDINLT